MSTWNEIPDQTRIEKTVSALQANGMSAQIVENAAEALQAVKQQIPAGASVMTMTSVTLDTIGASDLLNASGTYDALKNKLYSLDPNTQKREQKQLASSPEYVIGSVHAITEQGNVVIASNTGSQLPAYAYGADHVVWVVGAQKVTATLDDAMQRLHDYVLPLESERAHKAYGVEGSFISKLLILNREVAPDRIHIIIVKEVLGF